jgi:hypothetical protein
MSGFKTIDERINTGYHQDQLEKKEKRILGQYARKK